MRICCLSDLHGYLPEIPDCDLCLIAGDIGPGRERDFGYHANWYDTRFRRWLEIIKVPVVVVAGNHDFIFEHQSDLVPSLPWTYLQDSACEFQGLKIFGSPWQPRFFDWAFNADEPFLKRAWSRIPSNTDILLLHGPPHGYGDWSIYGNVHTGSPSLTERILEVKPRLVVAGHIHSGYGRYAIGDSVFINAAFVDEAYEPVNPPVVVEI